MSVWILTGPKPGVLLGLLLFLQMVLIGKDPAGKDRQSMQYSRLSRWRRQRSGTGVKMSSTYYGKSYHIMSITFLSHRNAYTRSNLLHTDVFYADMTIVVQKRLKARCRHLCIILGVRHHCRSLGSLHQSRFQHRCQKMSKDCDLLTPLTARTALGTCGASEATCERS